MHSCTCEYSRLYYTQIEPSYYSYSKFSLNPCSYYVASCPGRMLILHHWDSEFMSVAPKWGSCEQIGVWAGFSWRSFHFPLPLNFIPPISPSSHHPFHLFNFICPCAGTSGLVSWYPHLTWTLSDRGIISSHFQPGPEPDLSSRFTLPSSYYHPSIIALLYIYVVSHTHWHYGTRRFITARI